MAFRLCLVFLLLALALVAVSSSSFDEASWGLTRLSANDDALSTCNGLVGDCIDVDEEAMMESEATRRMMAQQGKFISYGALRRNAVPCNRRGHSYYNCVKRGKANPYRRGCSHITHCARYTD